MLYVIHIYIYTYINIAFVVYNININNHTVLIDNYLYSKLSVYRYLYSNLYLNDSKYYYRNINIDIRLKILYYIYIVYSI